MEVICIDDSYRPSLIPISKWIKKDQIYHVLEAVKCNPQGGLLGFRLQEIELGTDTLPYLYFAARRFKIPVPEETIEEEEVEELVV